MTQTVTPPTNLIKALERTEQRQIIWAVLRDIAKWVEINNPGAKEVKLPLNLEQRVRDNLPQAVNLGKVPGTLRFVFLDESKAA